MFHLADDFLLLLVFLVESVDLFIGVLVATLGIAFTYYSGSKIDLGFEGALGLISIFITDLLLVLHLLLQELILSIVEVFEIAVEHLV